MNIYNDDLSVKEKLLDTNINTIQRSKQWAIDDPKNDIKSINNSSHSSAESLIIPNNQDESLTDNDISDSEINFLPEIGNSPSSIRRKGGVLSDSESNFSPTSTLLAQSGTRRRALSTTSKPKDRFSMHELGHSIIDDANNRFLLPSRHSMAFDNSFNVKTRNSMEGRERIGNAGKGFGNLINDEGGKGSIADLIADVKDEDAVKLAKITLINAGQKNRTRNTEMDIEKIAQKNEYSNLEFHPSETTLSNSKACKQFLESKYNILFEIINNNGVYNPNPLTIAKNRRNDTAREGSDRSLGSSNSRLMSNKSRGPLLHRKELIIWDVSHMEIIKEYKQRNSLDQVLTGVRTNGHEATNNEDKDYSIFKKELESDETKKQQNYPQSLQIFNPPTTQETQTINQSREKEERSSSEQLKAEKYSSPSNLSSIATMSKGKEIFNGKSKKWPINLFKRKDKKYKNGLNSSDFGTIQVSEDSLASQANVKDVSDSSSGNQTPRSSFEDTRSLSEKGNDSMQQVDIMPNDESHYEPEPGGKYEKDILEENDRIDDWTDDASSRRSFDSRNSNSSVGSLNDGHYSGDERQHELAESSELKVAEERDEREDETETGRETVSVNLDILPQELVDMMTKQGIIDRNVDNGHSVKLDKSDRRLIEIFKFHRLIGYEANLLELHISLVCNNSEDTGSLSQDFSDKIKRYDECIGGTIKLLENNEILLAERINFIKDNNYIPDISNSFSFSPPPDTSTFSSDIFNQQCYLPIFKMNIREGIKLLSNKLDNIQDTASRLERQHASFTGEMKTIQDKIEEIKSSVNIHELKILEDEIHLLTDEGEKTIWIDVFYLMMSYVLAGIMFMFWFIVACFKLFRKTFLLLSRIWRPVLSSD